MMWHFRRLLTRTNVNPSISVMTWGNTPYTQSFFSQTVPYMVILYTTCAFSQNLLEFPVSAISGLLIAMRCYSTFPSISDGCKWQWLLSLLFHRWVFYILSVCLGIADFTSFFSTGSCQHCLSLIAGSVFTFPNSSQILHLRALVNIFYFYVEQATI